MSNALNIVQKFFPYVEKVKDATTAIELEVTLADVRKGKPRSHTGCPLAQVCKRMKYDGAIISRRRAYLIKDKIATRYEVPESVAREVVSNDRGGGTVIGTYELQKPGKDCKLGTIHASGKKDGSRPISKPRHFTSGVRTILGSAHT